MEEGAKGNLEQRISPIDIEALSQFIQTKQDKLQKKTEVIHERKLLTLGVRLHLSSCKPDKDIFNYLTYVFSAREKFLLSIGLDFSLPVYKPSFVKYFLPFVGRKYFYLFAI